eukprot:COSAG04_NODE_31840_length_254_cov_1.141935_1_plen_42_part_10
MIDEISKIEGVLNPHQSQRIVWAYIAVGHEYPPPLRPHPLQL